MPWAAMTAAIVFGADQPACALRGTVEDISGGAVPGATLKLRGESLSKDRSATANGEGVFEFRGLACGKYTIRARAKDFDEGEYPVTVSLNGKPVRIRIEVSETSANITVNESISPVAATNLDTAEIDQTAFKHFPLKDGDPLALPSLFADPAMRAVTGGPKVIVDGIEGDGLELPASSIKRAYVNRNPYSAEFARPGRGRIEVTTRKGTHRRYRGMINYLARNSALNARNPLAPEKAPMNRNIFEAQLDGPLGARMTFFVAARFNKNDDAAVVAAITPGGPLTANIGAPERKSYLLGRLDYRFNVAHKLIFRYKFKDNSYENQNVGGFHLAAQAVESWERENEAQGTETAVFSPSLSNEVRVAWRWRPSRSRRVFQSPGIVVPGAFEGGGAPAGLERGASAGEIQDTVSYFAGAHALRFGAGVRPRSYSTVDRSGFNGMFTYPDLAAYARNQAQVFTINAGDPLLSYNLTEFFGFVQDEIRVRPNLMMSAGVRAERQMGAPNSSTLAPRAGLAWSPGGGQTVVRAGAGLFFDRQTEAITERALAYGGNHITQIVLRDVDFGPAAIPDNLLSRFPASLTHVASGNQPPYLFQWNASAERRLAKGKSFLSVDFSRLTGRRLYRSRNLNAPFPGSGQLPFPGAGNMNQIETSGMLENKSLTVTFHTQAGKRLDFHTQYTLAKTRDDTSGPFAFPANPYDLRGEFGRSDLDRRHRWVWMGMLRLPWRMRSSSVVTLLSGVPFNVTTGRDDNRDSIVNDRPAGIGRNTGAGPSEANVDIRLSKEFTWPGERGRIEFAGDAFNLFNHFNPRSFVGVLRSPFYGRPNSALAARQVQCGIKLTF